MSKYVESLLVLADITGYTQFLRLHTLSKYHAEEIVAELIEGLIDAVENDLYLSKIEGDAVFFYLPIKEEGGQTATLLSRSFLSLFRSFMRKRSELSERRICICDACSTAGDLTLKVVAHLGGVYEREIRGHKELAGPDVVLAHRLLKNNLPKRPYVLATRPLYEILSGSWPCAFDRHTEMLPDFENVEFFVTYLDSMDFNEGGASAESPRIGARLGQFGRIFWRGLLRQLGLRHRSPRITASFAGPRH